MPQRRRKSPPSYRHHKPSGQAVVSLNGRDHYLGKHGSRESKDAYDRLVAEWLTGGRMLPTRSPAPKVVPREEPPPAPVPSPAARPEPAGPKVRDVLLAYMDHAATYYRGPDGKPTPEVKNLAAALRPVRDLYDEAPAAAFGPLALRAVREAMIADGLSRKVINARINRIRRCFRWAASVEKIDAAIARALATVEPLQPGRSGAPERPPVEAVPLEVVEATLPHLNPIVAAMVRVQLLTGCRGAEVATMRAADITPAPNGNLEYRPRFHKTAWRGKSRVIVIGPRAQAVLKPFLEGRDPEAFLFDPREAVADHHAARGDRRKTKRTPSEVAKRKASPGRGHADHYDRRTYCQAVVRACRRAFPHPIAKVPRDQRTAAQRAELARWEKAHRWSPLQLRHAAATLVRQRFGLEGAQVHLGHAKADVTQIYAERDMMKSHAIASEIG